MSNTVKAVRLEPNAATMNRFMTSLTRSVYDMKNDYRRLFNGTTGNAGTAGAAMDSDLYTSIMMGVSRLNDKWRDFFDDFSERWAKSMVSDFSAQAGRDVNRAASLSSPNSMLIRSVDVSERTKLHAIKSADNAASLVKSIQSDFASKLSAGISDQLLTPGQSFSKMRSEINSVLTSQYRTHKNKAKNLALDQTRKVYQGITEERQRDYGMTKYIWRHAGGSKEPRPYHKNVLAGQTFDVNDPPVMDLKTGERGNPGDDYNCKCYKELIIEF